MSNYEEHVKYIWDLYHSIAPELEAWVRAKSSDDTIAEDYQLAVVGKLATDLLATAKVYRLEIFQRGDKP
jgi:hypothetical protein